MSQVNRDEILIQTFLGDPVSEEIYQVGIAVGYRRGVEEFGRSLLKGSREAEARFTSAITQEIEIRTEKLRSAILKTRSGAQ